MTTLTGIAPTALRQGTSLSVVGTGFGPAFSIRVGTLDLAPLTVGENPFVWIPTDGTAPLGLYPVEIVNPEGCRSQESVFVEILPPGSACGLVGIEPLAVLFGLVGRQRLRRRFAAA